MGIVMGLFRRSPLPMNSLHLSSIVEKGQASCIWLCWSPIFVGLTLELYKTLSKFKDYANPRI
jgi:hypothetical protein